MSDLEVYFLISIAFGICFVNWRTGVLMCVVVGFLQDPLRKIMPNEPVYFTALVGGALAVTFLGARFHNVRLSFKPIHAWNSVLRTPLALFIGLVLIQSVAGFIRTGSAIVAAIGTVAYLAPLPAILIGYQFSRTDRDVQKFIALYVVFSVLMVSGVYLSYAGYAWQSLKQVGEGLTIYDPTLGKIVLHSGFLRSPEIAAWHGASAACLLVLMSIAVRRKAILRCAAGSLVLFVIGALVFTGRRKFLVEVVLFIAIYGTLLLWFSKRIRSTVLWRSLLLAAGGLAVALMAYASISSDEYYEQIRPYYQRGLMVQGEAGSRLSNNTFESFQYVIARNGVLGSGAGTGSQGSQYFRGEDDIVGGAAEGGLGKVLAELGVPGLLLLLLVVVSFGRYLWSIIRYIKDTKELDPVLAKLAFGFMAFLFTNGFVYMIGHQVFGDPFVLIMLGFFLGFVIATPRMNIAPKGDPVALPLGHPAAHFGGIPADG
jgi:hypothetical protein